MDSYKYLCTISHKVFIVRVETRVLYNNDNAFTSHFTIVLFNAAAPVKNRISPVFIVGVLCSNVPDSPVH